MSTRAYGADAIAALKLESTYGVAPSGNYHRMPFNSSSLGSARGLINDPVLGQGRDPYAPQQGVINVDGEFRVPLDLRYMGLWLTLLLGDAVSTDETTHQKHIWKSGAEVLPSASIEIQHPKPDKHFMNVGCMVDAMELNFRREGIADAVFSVLAQGETEAANPASGTLQTLAYTPFNRFQGAVKKGGVAIANLSEATLRYSNNMERVEAIRADGKIEGIDPTQASCTGTLRARFSSDSLFTAAFNNTPVDLEYSYVIDSNKSLVIAVHEVYLPKPKLDIGGPGGIDAVFDFQAARNDSAATMMTVTLKNDVAGSVY